MRPWVSWGVLGVSSGVLGYPGGCPGVIMSINGMCYCKD